MSKFCWKCGTENTEGAKFCRSCGASFQGMMPETDSVKSEAAAVPKNNKKKWIIIGAAAAAAVVVILLLVLNLGKTLNLTDYLEIEYSGPDGYAEAKARINEQSFTADALKALGYSEKDLASMGYSSDSAIDVSDLAGGFLNLMNQYSAIMSDAQAIESVYRNIEVTLDQSENLKNGDVVTATAAFKGNGSGSKLSVRGGEKKFEVSGLAAVTDLDPFDRISLSLSGVEPYGKAELMGTEYYADYPLYYTMDKDSGLSTGDTVTVSVSYDEEELLEQGIHITRDTAEYSVDKLEDAKSVDLFEGITVKYEGYNKSAYAYLDPDSKYVSGREYDTYVYYEIENNDNLSNGDIIVITAVYEEEDLARNGLRAESGTKLVTVKGLVTEVTPTPTPTPTATPTPTPEPTRETTPTPAPVQPASGDVPIQYGLYAPAADFIFPESSSRYLSYDEIDAALKAGDSNTMYRNGQLAINEILARYGYAFDPDSARIGARDAASKFGGLSWYQQAMQYCGYDDPNALIGAMNAYEKANISAITDWQYANDAWEYRD